MRDKAKLLILIRDNPEASNEYLLNSSGYNPNMSIEELALENRCINALKKEDASLINELIKYV